MPTDILAMRAAADGRLVATSSDDETVRIWEAPAFTEVARIKPGFDGGESRLALDGTSSRVFSGTWEAGLTCYDYAEHRVVWQRADLLGIQGVDCSPAFPSSIFVALEAPEGRLDEPGIFSGVMQLDAATGRELWRTNDAHQVHLHPSRPILVLEDRREEVLRILDESHRLIGSTPMAYFAVLEVAFHADRIALAEGEKGVRLIDPSGKVLGSYRPPSRRPNCLHVTFVGGADLLAVYDSWEGSYVTQLDGAGKFRSEYERDSHEDICFVGDGTQFLDAEGRICQTATGVAGKHIDG